MRASFCLFPEHKRIFKWLSSKQENVLLLVVMSGLCFSIFHTVLFHRSFGKFTYQDDSSYIIGTIGYEDVDCDYIGGNNFDGSFSCVSHLHWLLV